MTNPNEAAARRSRGALRGKHDQEELAYIEEARCDGDQRMVFSPTSNGDQGVLLPDWGGRKRSRNRRVHPAGNPVDSFNPKPNGLADESFVLHRKTMPGTMRVEAVRPLERETLTSRLASDQSILEATKHAISAKERQAKVFNGRLAGDAKQGTEGLMHLGREGIIRSGHYPLDQQSKAYTMADPDLFQSPDRYCNISLSAGSSSNAIPSKNKNTGLVSWPTFVIPLSWKEKQVDFLLINGTRLPDRRPKRMRSKGVVERALSHYSLPGSSLANISPSRYDVKEKNHPRKRSRGIKALGSLQAGDSDCC